MSKKIFDFNSDILVLLGIYFAIRFIYTKEVYMQLISGYKINTLFLLIFTIVIVVIYRQIDKKIIALSQNDIRNNNNES
jgi:hypothetical protein